MTESEKREVAEWLGWELEEYWPYIRDDEESEWRWVDKSGNIVAREVEVDFAEPRWMGELILLYKKECGYRKWDCTFAWLGNDLSDVESASPNLAIIAAIKKLKEA